MSVTVSKDRYVENEDFVPDPTNHSGTLDTTGTSGTEATINEVTPVFRVADNLQAQQAAAALDPEDTSVPASSVVLPTDKEAASDARERITEAGKSAKDDDVVIGGLTPAQEDAAEESEKSASEAQVPGTKATGKASAKGSSKS